MKSLLKKRYIIPAILALVITGSIVYWLSRSQNTVVSNPTAQTNSNDASGSNINYNPPTNEEKNSGDSSKDQFAHNGNKTDTNATSNTPKNVNVEISSINQDGQTLMIRTMIQAIDNTGTCTLTLSKAAATAITKHVGVQALASFSTCEGFDISTSGLAKGAWQAKVSFTSSKYNGVTSRSITIK